MRVAGRVLVVLAVVLMGLMLAYTGSSLGRDDDTGAYARAFLGLAAVVAIPTAVLGVVLWAVGSARARRG